MEEGKRGKKKMKVGEREEGNVGDRQELKKQNRQTSGFIQLLKLYGQRSCSSDAQVYTRCIRHIHSARR